MSYIYICVYKIDIFATMKCGEVLRRTVFISIHTIMLLGQFPGATKTPPRYMACNQLHRDGSKIQQSRQNKKNNNTYKHNAPAYTLFVLYVFIIYPSPHCIFQFSPTGNI